MSKTAVYPLIIEYGTSLSLPINVTGLTLTGATALMHIRKNLAAPITLTLTTADGSITIIGQQVRVNLTKVQTTLIDTGSVYDMLITMADLSVVKLLKGNITINPTVTRS